MGNVCSSSKHDADKEYFSVSLHAIRKRESKLKGEYYPVGASVPFLLQDIALALARSKLSVPPPPSTSILGTTTPLSSPSSPRDDDAYSDEEEYHNGGGLTIQALPIPLDVDNARIREIVQQINFITVTTKRVHLSMFSMLLSLDGLNPSREELVYLFMYFLKKLPFPVLKPSIIATFLDAIKADPSVQNGWAASAGTTPLPSHLERSEGGGNAGVQEEMLSRWKLLTGTHGARALGKVVLSPALVTRIKSVILSERALDTATAGSGKESGADHVGSFSCFHWVLSTIDSVPGVFFPFAACTMMVEAMSVSVANKNDLELVTVALLQMYCPQWVALHLRQLSALQGAATPTTATSPSAAVVSPDRRRRGSVTETTTSPPIVTGGTVNPTRDDSTSPPTPLQNRRRRSSVSDQNQSSPQLQLSGIAALSTTAATIASTFHRNSLVSRDGGGRGGVDGEDESQCLSAPQGPFQNSQNTSAIAKSSVDDSSSPQGSDAFEHHHSHQRRRSRGGSGAETSTTRRHTRQDVSGAASSSMAVANDLKSAVSAFMGLSGGGGGNGDGDTSWRSGTVSIARGDDDDDITEEVGRNGTVRRRLSSSPLPAAVKNNNNPHSDDRSVGRDDGGAEVEEDAPEWPVKLRATRTQHNEISDKLRDAQRAFMLASDTSTISSEEGTKKEKGDGKGKGGGASYSSSPSLPYQSSSPVDHQKFQNVIALVELLQRDNQQLRSELGGAMEDISDAFERLHSENVRLKTLVTNVNINQAFKERVQTVLTQMAESNLAVTEDITRTRHEVRDLRETILMNVEDRDSVHSQIATVKRETADVHLKWVEVERRVLDASTRVSAVERRIQDTNQRSEEVAAAVGSCVLDHDLLTKRLYSAGAADANYAAAGRMGF